MHPKDFEYKWQLEHEHLCWLTRYKYRTVVSWFETNRKVPQRVLLWFQDLDWILEQRGYLPGKIPDSFFLTR